MSTVFTFGHGDEAVIQYKEPVEATRLRTTRITRWRPCRTEAEKLEAIRDLFAAVLYGVDRDGDPLFDIGKLRAGDFDDINRVFYFRHGDVFDPEAELTPELQDERALAEALWRSVAEAVDPGRIIHDPDDAIVFGG